ncbi:hypothetical protein [Sphingomonas sanguinis]|uniref:hypothetical protein n=1 Tax=Sphingomonas sanguinis TaxID=33051 RepID=UPI000AFEB3E9|nr:hypothetical protein [Sphingomonas sanguinis]
MLMIMMGALMMRIDAPLAPLSDACEIGRLAVADYAQPSLARPIWKSTPRTAS